MGEPLLIVPVLRVIHAALPGMLSRGTGTIINVSSIEGLRPSPNYANYAAAKAYVNVLTQALDEEYGSQGIRFQAVCPGPTQTEIWEKAGIDTTGYDLSRWVTPEDVVEASLLSLQRRELVCVPGAPGRGEWIRRVVPQRVLRRAAGDSEEACTGIAVSRARVAISGISRPSSQDSWVWRRTPTGLIRSRCPDEPVGQPAVLAAGRGDN